MIRTPHLFLFVALTFRSLPVFSQAGQFDGTWRGKYACGPVQTLSPTARPPFAVDVDMVVINQRAEIHRGTAQTKESHTGIVSSDGQLNLAGGGIWKSGAGVPWATRFRGTFSENAFRAEGVITSVNGKVKFRDCTLTLERRMASTASQTPGNAVQATTGTAEVRGGPTGAAATAVQAIPPSAAPTGRGIPPAAAAKIEELSRRVLQGETASLKTPTSQPAASERSADKPKPAQAVEAPSAASQKKQPETADWRCFPEVCVGDKILEKTLAWIPRNVPKEPLRVDQQRLRRLVVAEDTVREALIPYFGNEQLDAKSFDLLRRAQGICLGFRMNGYFRNKSGLITQVTVEPTAEHGRLVLTVVAMRRWYKVERPEWSNLFSQLEQRYPNLSRNYSDADNAPVIHFDEPDDRDERSGPMLAINFAGDGYIMATQAESRRRASAAPLQSKFPGCARGVVVE